ncbi:MAG: CpXC domain-containing protein [Candidatus Micrarchaeota archaeon]
MTSHTMRTLKCTCGGEFEAKMYMRINLEKNPELGRDIESGDVNTHKCPSCGRIFTGMIPKIIRPSERAEKLMRGEVTVKYEW